jgi:hypothetical protein
MRRQRSQTVRLKSLLFALAALASAAAAHAQDMHVDRLELLDAGFYETTKTTVTGSTPAGAGAVTGSVKELGEVKLSPEPPATSARVGIGFGVHFRSFGARDGERAVLRSVWTIPAPGIVNPANGTTFRQSVAEFATTIGTNHVRAYSFDEPWEVVPGTWTLEIRQGDRKLLEKSFEIK